MLFLITIFVMEPKVDASAPTAAVTGQHQQHPAALRDRGHDNRVFADESAAGMPPRRFENSKL